MQKVQDVIHDIIPFNLYFTVVWMVLKATGFLHVLERYPGVL